MSKPRDVLDLVYGIVNTSIDEWEVECSDPNITEGYRDYANGRLDEASETKRKLDNIAVALLMTAVGKDGEG